MAGFGRIVLVGVTVAVGLGGAALRAQTALEDPRNAPKIFANTCSACHKSPQGLAKSGGTASFLRQHYTTGPEMSAAMAAYLASAGSGPASKKGEKKEPTTATAAKATPGQKQAGHSFTDGSTDVSRPSSREKQQDKQKTAKGEPKHAPGSQTAAPPVEPPPAVVERAVQPGSATAALSTPASEPPAPPAVTLDIPMPDFPTGPPPDLTQPAVFSSAPLP